MELESNFGAMVRPAEIVRFVVEAFPANVVVPVDNILSVLKREVPVMVPWKVWL